MTKAVCTLTFISAASTAALMVSAICGMVAPRCLSHEPIPRPLSTKKHTYLQQSAMAMVVIVMAMEMAMAMAMVTAIKGVDT